MSHCQNCKLFIAKCKSECCTMVPIDRQLLTDNFYIIQTPIEELVPFGGNDVVPITKTGKCPFLSADSECVIYDQRPEVCKLFGNEKHPNLTCAYQKANGEARSEKEFKKIHKKHIESVNKFLKR